MSIWISRETPLIGRFLANKDGQRFKTLISNNKFDQAIHQLTETIKSNPSANHLSWYMNQLFLKALEPAMRSTIDKNLRTIDTPKRNDGWDHLYQECSYTIDAKAGAFPEDEKEKGPKLENIRLLLAEGKDHEALDKILEVNNEWSSWVGPHVRLATFIPPLLRQ